VSDPLELDEVIHAPKRLAICAFLQRVDGAEFPVIRDALGVSDSVLSKHLSALAEAQYVKLEKRIAPGKSRYGTWASMTLLGRAAFRDHVAALRRIVDGADG
jgi:DNA-binding transcriptional ArsR family regulator